MSENKSAIYPRLCLAYFMQFAIWGSWGFALTGFADHLGFKASNIGWLGAVAALGAIISPLLVGPIADRHLAAQKVMAILHGLSGICLLIASTTNSFLPLMVLMLLHGLFFMPTIALINSVVFKNLPNSENAPRVFMFGTIGWIAAVLFASVFLGGATNANFLTMAGVISLALAAYSITLPDTPPKGAGSGDVFGLGALKLFKDTSFSIFIACAFLVSLVGCGFFFCVTVPMLQQRGYPSPLALTTLCQFAEIIFMFTLPFFVTKIGLKKVLVVGMLAWGVRYLCFMNPSFGMALLGLVLHGFCYSFLYVGAYMYADKIAPDDMKASVQSFLAFLLLGVGMFAGAKLGGFLMGASAPELTEMTVASSEDPVGLPAWDDANMADSAWRFLDLSGTIKGMLSDEEAETTPHLGVDVDKDQNNEITLAELQAIPEEGLTYGEVVYTAADLEAVARDIIDAEGDGAELPDADVKITRQQWLGSQANGWSAIFLLPALFALVICAVFVVAGKDPAEEAAEEKGEEADVEAKPAEESPAEEAAPEAPSEE